MKFPFMCILVLFSELTLIQSESAILVPFKPGESCEPKDIVENDCNYCSCTPKGFLCSTKNCDRRKRFAKEFHILNYEEALSYRANLKSNQQCIPDTLYENINVKCLCNAQGQWPHQVCKSMFQTPLPSVDETNRTHNEAKHADNNFGILLEKIRRFNKVETIYGNCTPGEEYYMDWRLCSCIRENRLSCVDNGKCPAKEEQDKVKIIKNKGEYPITELNTDEEKGYEIYNGNHNGGEYVQQVESIYSKCIPGLVYYLDDNLCDCTRERRLQCSEPTPDPRRPIRLIGLRI